MPGAECKKECQENRVAGGTPDLNFSAPVIMKYADGRAEVNQPVKHLPAVPAEAADPFSCRSNRKRDHRKKTEEARDDERALQENVLKDCGKIEVLIQPYVRGQMYETVKESEETHHPAEADQTAPSGKAPQGSYGQGDHQETERPDARSISDIFKRISAQVAGKSVKEK